MRNATSATPSQKNGVVVRQVVGYGRLSGKHAYEQLDELYRALRLYVNCFQPSMKLVAKQVEGRTIHRTYDVARTPLQRLLLSDVLPASRQQELSAVMKALDPLRLFQQVERLQQALFRCEISGSVARHRTPALVSFELEGVTTELFAGQARAADEGGVGEQAQQKAPENIRFLDWRHTCNDPFVGQWEQIYALVQADPSRSGGAIFRHLQSQFPGRYQPGHLRTLQRGIRKIRAHLLATREEPREPEVIQAAMPLPVELLPATPPPVEAFHPASGCTPTWSGDQKAGEMSTGGPSAALAAEPPARGFSGKATRSVAGAATPWERTPPTPASHTSARRRSRPLTIERAIQSYLQAHRTASHRPKTLEWHQTVLHQLQDYLLQERLLLHVSQITTTDLDAWIASVSQTPTPVGRPRSPSTIETYARSARAFCSWLVHQGVLPCSPMSQEAFPRARVPFPAVVSPERFERFVQASCPRESQALTTKRDRALRLRAL